MTPYVCLVVYLLILPLFIQNRNLEKHESKCLWLSLLPIYLLLALKAPSVGRDTDGYRRMYESFFLASWSNYDLYWTEWGYETLEMIFTHIFKFSFTQFAATIYIFICVSYYKFWKRYSKDVCLSCLIYICFGLICFDLSGLRNALALAIFLFSVPYAERRGLRNSIKCIAIVFMATQIHSSAYACFFYFIVIRYSLPKIAYILAPAFVLAARPALALLVRDISNKSITGNAFGGNLVFYILVLLFPLILWHLWKNTKSGYGPECTSSRVSRVFKELAMPIRAFYLGVLLLIFSGGGNFSRVANFGLFFMTLIIPNTMDTLNKKSKEMVRGILTVFMVCYFWIFKLSVNELDMLPYVAFWKQL